MLLVNKSNIDNLSPLDAESLKYCKIVCKDKWKINLVKELIQAKYDDIHIENLNKKEIFF